MRQKLTLNEYHVAVNRSSSLNVNHKPKDSKELSSTEHSFLAWRWCKELQDLFKQFRKPTRLPGYEQVRTASSLEKGTCA